MGHTKIQRKQLYKTSLQMSGEQKRTTTVLPEQHQNFATSEVINTNFVYQPQRVEQRNLSTVYETNQSYLHPTVVRTNNPTAVRTEVVRESGQNVVVQPRSTVQER